VNNIDIDIDELKSWIGNEEVAYDEVSTNLETRFRATLDQDPGMPQRGEIASSGLHWALAPAVVKLSLLGKDSHPKKGEFLPPVPLPRRMWAGCQTKFFKPLRIGDQIKKISSVFDINLKNGKSGLLCFVTAKYEFYVNEELVIEEFHDLVYRNFSKEDKDKKNINTLPVSNSVYKEKIHTHPTMLFRYSAITFNGHRIHYDYPYSTKEEGYQDLVFHGPLQATLMLQAAERYKKKRVSYFSHRGVAPVFANQDLFIDVENKSDGNVNCFTSTENAGMTMKAEAVF
jgi:3-methylfumaryl-CoA hydratase